MKLKSLRIENFKCIQDTEEFSLSPVTCLVGKNEAGKTAILQALYKLNPVEPRSADFELLEYPRRYYSEYTERHKTNPDNVLTTIWDLEEADKAALAEILGPEAATISQVTINKGYDNQPYWTLEINEAQVVTYYSRELFQEDIGVLAGIATIVDLISRLDQLEIESPAERRANLLNTLKSRFPNRDAASAAIAVLEKCLPTFLYFSDYYKMPGQVALDQLLAKQQQNNLTEGDRVFIALLDLANTSVEDVKKIGRFEQLQAELEGISNRITQEIFTFWSQNQNLRVKFHYNAAQSGDPPPFNSGFIFRTRVENLRHSVTIPFDERSTGFVWFFSFLVWFSQVRKIYGDNLFILLDEPGLGLHAKAQGDLLRYIGERLRPHYQAIYTAHSPFMINPTDLLNARTVEDMIAQDGSIMGTKVGDKVLSTDADTVFPLQAALGYDITQTLFVGEHTLLVEGPSDLLYLKWFSEELIRRERKGLDLRWVIAPAGSIDRIASFITLLGANRLHLAVLTDFKRPDRQKLDNLRELHLLKDSCVFTADMYAGQNEADMEDIIGRTTYSALVNECYGLTGKRKFKTESDRRVIRDIEEHFRVLPPETPEYSHYRPALYLTENGATLRESLPDLDQALERFESLFQDVNALLDESSRT